YGTGHVFRQLTSLRGRVRHGNSGSPAVDAQGRVEPTVFASLIGARGGLGVPTKIVAQALDDAQRGATVSTGGCAPELPRWSGGLWRPVGSDEHAGKARVL